MIKRPDNITSMNNDEEFTEGKIKEFLNDLGKDVSDAYYKAKAPGDEESQKAAEKTAEEHRANIAKAHKDIRDNPSYGQHLTTIKTYNDEIGAPTADALDTIASKLSGLAANNNSIVARARKSVLQFPIYITQTLPVNEAHIIGKLFERVYASLVQTVMSQHPYISEEEANDLVFLKQFHTNLKESTDLVFNEFYTPIDTIDEILQESVFYSEQLSPSMLVEFRKLTNLNEDLVKENARLLHEPLTGFTYLQEDVEKRITYGEVKREHWDEIARDIIDKDDKKKKIYDAADDATKKKMRDKEIEKRKAAIRALDKGNTIDGIGYLGGKYIYSLKTEEKTGSRNPVEEGPAAPVLLKDSDIKKTNGMLPYQMAVSFRVKGGNGHIDRDITFVIGIKSVMHLIHVQDLADELRDLIMGNSKTLQKVRYKTGEITFMDYMFNIKGLKSDASKGINGRKKWLNTLKRLGEYNKMNGSLLKKPIEAITGGNVPIPNGTLVLSQSDVTTLVDRTGIDISVVSTAKKLARTLFLIAIVVVDPSRGSMRVLFPDSDTDWDVQSLASIDAELAKTDNSQIMRELNRMVNR